MDTGIVSLGSEGFRVTAEVRGLSFDLDEPEAVGGTNEGPTPVEALLAALGACTAMTLRLYADRKGLPLQGVRVGLTHSQVPRDTCAECPPDPTFPIVDRIERSIEVEGDLSDADVARLLQIAERCPVHRVLTRHPVVRSEIHRGPGAPGT